MEVQNEIKGVYIRKTYPWETADRVPANYIKKWFASISKETNETNTPVSTQWVNWIHNFVGSTHCFRCVR